MTYNVPIFVQQGGSEMSLNAGASLNAVSGAVRIGNSPFYAGKAAPTFSASPGSVYIRSDGTNSNIYVNVASGAAGQSWQSACIVD